MRKNPNQCSKIHIMYDHQACKKFDQEAQHIEFHKAMNITCQINTRFNQKYTIKKSDINKS